MPVPYRVAIVGTGWRAQGFARLARALSEHLELVGFSTTSPAKLETVERSWGTTGYLDPVELVRRSGPDLVLVSVPRSAVAEVIVRLVDEGVHVLTETPPAADAADLYALWGRVGAGRLVHVAEQYPYLPGHAARRAVAWSGLLGEVSSVQVSSTHSYHAVAIIRGLLGRSDHAPVRVSAQRFTAPLVDPLTRAGWTDDDTEKTASTVLATLDLAGAHGVYDFTDNQARNRLRQERIVVRGSRGEISDDTVVRLAGPRTVLTSSITRTQLGVGLNLDGYDTEHLALDGEVLYRNPFPGHRLMDDEIAMATVLLDACRWSRGESAGPYPLAQGSQDHLISLAIADSAERGVPVVTDTPPWSGA